MGTFRVEVQATGNHGCQREVGDGGVLGGRCTDSSCVDCITRDFVDKLKTAGAYFNTPIPDNPQPNSDGYARITHWPGQDNSIVDDILTSTRKGNF